MSAPTITTHIRPCNWCRGTGKRATAMCANCSGRGFVRDPIKGAVERFIASEDHYRRRRLEKA